MNAQVRRVLVVIALVCAAFSAIGYPPGVPLLVIAVMLLAISLL